MNLRIAFSALILATATTQAHPGHDPLAHGFAHFAKSPTHLWPALALCAVLLVAAQFVTRRAERNWIRAGAAVIATVALVS